MAWSRWDWYGGGGGADGDGGANPLESFTVMAQEMPGPFLARHRERLGALGRAWPWDGEPELVGLVVGSPPGGGPEAVVTLVRRAWYDPRQGKQWVTLQPAGPADAKLCGECS